MKVHIVKPDQPSVDNFARIEVLPDSMDLSSISDNECSMILANDVLDSFPVDKIGDLVSSLLKKVRMRGEIVIGGTDIRLFCKMVSNDQINEFEACKIISSVQSMSNLEIVSQIVSQAGFQILSTELSGIHHEVKAKRGQ